jgi:hypothetical protein
MKLPRFSVRWLMVAVAIVGLITRLRAHHHHGAEI